MICKLLTLFNTLEVCTVHINFPLYLVWLEVCLFLWIKNLKFTHWHVNIVLARFWYPRAYRRNLKFLYLLSLLYYKKHLKITFHASTILVKYASRYAFICDHA